MQPVTFNISFSIPEVEERLKSFLMDHDNSNICAFAEVKKSQEIARVEIHKDESGEESDGEDHAPGALPHFFNTNDLVSRIEQDKYTFIYIAKENGLARFSPGAINIMDNPIIAQDIGPATGNIKFSGNIAVQGHVLNGYEIECGGNLNIVKSVEDNVKIVCGGNLEVGWGISGKKTEVTCRKNAKAGFIEKSTVICDGDLEIKGNMFQAKVFCRGKTRVIGQGMTSKSRGAVVGGVINSLNGLTFKSIGSESCETQIIVGIDLRVEEQLSEAEQLFGVLKKKILLFQQEVETYLAAVGSADKLGQMNRKAKDLVRSKLFKLKKQQNTLAELNDKIRVLKRNLYPSQMDKVIIIFEEFADPVIKVKFNKKEMTMKERAPGRTSFKLIEGKISNIV